jgi:hypothetical protein
MDFSLIFVCSDAERAEWTPRPFLLRTYVSAWNCGKEEGEQDAAAAPVLNALDEPTLAGTQKRNNFG